MRETELEDQRFSGVGGSRSAAEIDDQTDEDADEDDDDDDGADDDSPDGRQRLPVDDGDDERRQSGEKTRRGDAEEHEAETDLV